MRWVAVLAMVSIAVSGLAQSPNEYLSLRKKHKVTSPSPLSALDTFTGSKILELKCLVKGTMELDGKNSLYAEINGQEQVVECVEVPGWLKGNEVAARLLVRATRQEHYGAVIVELISAAGEADIAKFDVVPKSAPVKSSAPARTKTSNASRSASKGRPLPAREAIAQYAPIYARFIANHNKKLSSAKAYEIASAVIGWSVQYDVDARLVMALLIAESDFNPAELSGPGATGLGQLMPETARELGVRNPWNTNENLYGTVKYLKTQMDRYGATEDNAGKLALALAAYNAGPGAVKKHGGVPPYRETQNYVRKVIRLYRQLCGA